MLRSDEFCTIKLANTLINTQYFNNTVGLLIVRKLTSIRNRSNNNDHCQDHLINRPNNITMFQIIFHFVFNLLEIKMLQFNLTTDAANINIDKQSPWKYFSKFL